MGEFKKACEAFKDKNGMELAHRLRRGQWIGLCKARKVRKARKTGKTPHSRFGRGRGRMLII